MKQSHQIEMGLIKSISALNSTQKMEIAHVISTVKGIFGRWYIFIECRVIAARWQDTRKDDCDHTVNWNFNLKSFFPGDIITLSELLLMCLCTGHVHWLKGFKYIRLYSEVHRIHCSLPHIRVYSAGLLHVTGHWGKHFAFSLYCVCGKWASLLLTMKPCGLVNNLV